MDQWISRIKVVLSAAPTWITLAISVLAAVQAVLVEQGELASVAGWIGTAIVWLGGAIAIIRRVSPVDSQDRGLLDD